MTNLQIISKDTPRPQVIQTMQTFTQALGVQCACCHVDEGRGGRQDYASDEKPTKKSVRTYLLMSQVHMAKNDKDAAISRRAQPA